MVNAKTNSLSPQISFVIFVGVFIFFCIGAYLIYAENVKQLNCLKPYAIDYCLSVNSSYISHDIVSFICNNTSYNFRIRGSSADYYYFLPEEKKKCGVGE